MPLPHLPRLIEGIALCFLTWNPLPSPAQTPLFEGRSQGVFEVEDAPPTAVVEGQGTDAISWGRAVDATTSASRLAFQGHAFRLGIDGPTTLGFFQIHNGRTTEGSTVDALNARLTLTFFTPRAATLEHLLALEVDTTENFSDGKASADRISLLNPYARTALSHQGEFYGLRLQLGRATAHAVTETEQLFLLEDASTTIPLEAVVCRALPTESREPQFSFEKIAGGDELVVSGNGSPEIVSGQSSDPSAASPSRYELLPPTTVPPPEIRTEMSFVVGTMRFFNGSVRSETAAETAVIRMQWGPNESHFDFPIQFITTPNHGSARASADSVLLTAPVSSQTLTVHGIPHVARIAWANPSPGGYTSPVAFAVEEGVSAEADLVLIFTRFTLPRRPFRLHVSTPSDRGLLFSWPSHPGNVYQLESSTTLEDFLADGDPLTASHSTTLVSRTLPAQEARYYRVVDLE